MTSLADIPMLSGCFPIIPLVIDNAEKFQTGIGEGQRSMPGTLLFSMHNIAVTIVFKQTVLSSLGSSENA